MYYIIKMIGKIYKIIHNQSNICYIGSTFSPLKKRWWNHKCSINKNNKYDCSITQYFKKFGFENFKIILIKEYEVFDKLHLQMYEQLWMNKIKNINKLKAFNPLFKERNKQVKKKYKANNKEEISIKNKEYYNREEVKAKYKEQFTCECGSTLTYIKRNRHLKSKKHIKYLDTHQ